MMVEFPRATRTDGEVRWAWVYGAVLGGLAVFAVMRWL